MYHINETVTSNGQPSNRPAPIINQRISRVWLTSSETIGRRMVVVETLLVKVVNVVPTRTKMRTMTGDGRAPTTPIELPITFDSPDFYTYQHQWVTLTSDLKFHW